MTGRAEVIPRFLGASVVPAASRTVSTARKRKLGAHHFAFMRGLVQGLPLRETWARYLSAEGESKDLRLVRSTVQWIRDEFAAAARREGRFGTARLVLVDVARLGADEKPLPSLDEFAEAEGLEDFSQADQIAAYTRKFGSAARRQTRRGRLIAKQLEALRWLERVVAQPPGLGDAVAAWLNPSLAVHLEAAEIFTIAQLLDRINGLGWNWCRQIGGVGTEKARRIERWLREHQVEIGREIGEQAQRQRLAVFTHELQRVVAPATDIRPLEKLLVPAELDGSRGVYRRPQAHCLRAASNDYAAVLSWIRSKRSLTPDEVARAKAKQRGRESGIEGPHAWMQWLSNTQRSYRKEAERFLLWAVIQKRKPMSSMTTEDCIEYRSFLADPAPRSTWCAPRGRERWSPLWRPFEGPLSPAAQRQAITILKSLYAFWVDKNYVMGNPWTGLTVPASAQPRMNAGRSFTQAQWRFIQGRLDEPKTSSARRLSLALRLPYATGLRASEAVAAKVDDMSWVEYPPDEDDDEHVEGWLLEVVGKGGRLRQVPLAADVIDEIKLYLVSRGLQAEIAASANQGTYLLGKASDLMEVAPQLHGRHEFDPKSGIAENTLYDQLKRFFADCAKVLAEEGDARGAQRFAKASTHWMRHTHASHSIAKGTRVEVAQDILGHASLATTTIYVTTEQKRRMKAMAKFMGSAG